MVEMVETAAILNQAGERSLVILDEIGRGTATFDGLSIAWAAIEHLHETNRCRALFATDFHELTALSATLRGCAIPSAASRNGTAPRWSCTRSCPAPPTALRHPGREARRPAGQRDRARQLVLAELEAEDRSSPRGFDDLPLFAASRRPAETTLEDAALDAVIAALTALDPDGMSPREVLEAIYALKLKAIS